MCNTTVQTVCSCLSTRHLSAGRVGAALSWALRGRCGPSAARAATHALRTYTRTRTLPARDLLRTAPAAMLLHDTLLFLGEPYYVAGSFLSPDITDCFVVTF